VVERAEADTAAGTATWLKSAVSHELLRFPVIRAPTHPDQALTDRTKIHEAHEDEACSESPNDMKRQIAIRNLISGCADAGIPEVQPTVPRRRRQPVEQAGA
jgi:hypothetical protein